MQNKMINNSKNWTSQETTHDSKRAALAVEEKHGYLSVDKFALLWGEAQLCLP